MQIGHRKYRVITSSQPPDCEHVESGAQAALLPFPLTFTSGLVTTSRAMPNIAPANNLEDTITNQETDADVSKFIFQSAWRSRSFRE